MNNTILVPGMTAEDVKEASMGYAVKVEIATTAKGYATPSIQVNGMDLEKTVGKALEKYDELRRKLKQYNQEG